MFKSIHKFLSRFRREEDGQMLLEFVILTPLVFTAFLTAVELGIYKTRHLFLDRGLDMAVRNVRLNTGTDYTHADIKDMVCDFAGFLNNCDSQLKLEMNPVDPRSFTELANDADCTDASLPVKPSRTFVLGGQNELMLLRACYKFDPIFPTAGLGYDFATNGDGAGMAKMVSIAAFVQEP